MQTISDGSEDNQNQTETFDEYVERFKRCASQSLAKLLDEQIESGRVAKAIVYDSFVPWVLGIVRGRGLLAAPLFTQSCSVCAVYYHLRNGSLKFPYEDRVVSLPGMPHLEVRDLPFMPKSMDPDSILITKLIPDQLSNIEEVDWVFFKQA